MTQIRLPQGREAGRLGGCTLEAKQRANPTKNLEHLQLFPSLPAYYKLVTLLITFFLVQGVEPTKEGLQ